MGLGWADLADMTVVGLAGMMVVGLADTVPGMVWIVMACMRVGRWDCWAGNWAGRSGCWALRCTRALGGYRLLGSRWAANR